MFNQLSKRVMIMRATKLFSGLILMTVFNNVMAADIESIKAKATSICASCHGVTGISASDAIPNLQGQKASYLASALKAYRDGSRKAPVMNNMATNLSDDEIQGLAGYFNAVKP